MEVASRFWFGRNHKAVACFQTELNFRIRQEILRKKEIPFSPGRDCIENNFLRFTCASVDQLELLVLLLLDLRPSITERDRPVKHHFLGGGIGINTEITQPLKLVAASRCRLAENGFNHRGG